MHGGSGTGTYSAPPWTPTATMSAEERARATAARMRASSHHATPGFARPARGPCPVASTESRAMRMPAARTISGANADAADRPAPTVASPAADSALIVSATVSGPASPAWLFAMPIASKPAAARNRAEAGGASSAFGPKAGSCGRAVSGDSRFATARPAEATSSRMPARGPAGPGAAASATPRPSITSPPKSRRTLALPGDAARSITPGDAVEARASPTCRPLSRPHAVPRATTPITVAMSSARCPPNQAVRVPHHRHSLAQERPTGIRKLTDREWAKYPSVPAPGGSLDPGDTHENPANEAL